MEAEVGTAAAGVAAEDLRGAWPLLAPDERAEYFHLLALEEASAFFLGLSSRDQAALLAALPGRERGLWLRSLAPDDAADLLQLVGPEERGALLELLDERSRREVTALLAYAEDDAGGLMSPRFARLRAEMSVEEAIRYLRKQIDARLETIYYAYVLDGEQRLLGVVSLRQLLAAPAERRVSEVMEERVVAVQEDTDQEAVAQVLRRHKFMAVPVLDAGGRMKGIITTDDLVHVMAEEATEDQLRFGGVEVLGAPYLQTGFLQMIRKRAGWLAALFLGELLTATAMGRFEEQIAQAVVLALFVPLIISSGGNSGSQASTLVIRAMALGEVRLRDWWRVSRRELGAGLALGTILATIGLIRILLWQLLFDEYGEHAARLAVTVAVSLLGVVTLGTLAGSTLPFLLRRLGFDPASASAPFVATLVDVSGLLLYFSAAALILRGTLL